MYVEQEIVAEKGSQRAALVRHFTEMNHVATAQIQKFCADMGTNPGRALEWGDQVFDATARKEVSSTVLYMLKHYTEFRDITQSLQSSMRDKARYVNNKSTSVSGNFLKENLLSHITLALEHVEHFT